MSADLDRLLADAAASPTHPVDVEALHARAERARHRDRLVAGLCAVVLVAVGVAGVLAVARGDQRVEFGPAEAPAGTATEGVTEPLVAIDPLHLVMSHQQVASAGQTITLAVVNASDGDFSYGADGALERWRGGEWEDVGDVGLARSWWESGGNVAQPSDPGFGVESIQYSAPPGRAGEPEWLTLPALEPGWYRLVRGGDGRQAAAVFEVVAAGGPIEPVLSVPWEDPYLSLDAAAVGSAGGPLDMVPAEGTDVAGRPDGEDIERAAQLSRWEQGDWSSPQAATVQLNPEEPVSNNRAVRVDIPSLEPGFWRVQIEAADGGMLTGYLWVVDELGRDEHADSSSDARGTDPSASSQPAWTALAADVATSPGVRVAARDADELAEAWAAASASTGPPAMPPDSAVLVVSVASSTCRSRSDVLGVEVAGRTIVVVLDEDGEFTRPCPGPEGTPRGTVFAVAVPLDVVPENSDVMIRTAAR